MQDPRYDDPAWLERMYNTRGTVPDHMELMQAWTRDSAAVREALPCHLDVAYGRRDGEMLDIFPGEPQRAPVLVFVGSSRPVPASRWSITRCARARRSSR